MSLKLYIKSGCPFCDKVLDYAVSHGIEIEKKDIKDPENLQGLLEKGGKRQVPFLVDKEKGISMYESNDIIRYLRIKYTDNFFGQT